MTKPNSNDLFKFGPWPGGINNVAREDSLAPSELREATNVDVQSPTGKVQTRGGYEQTLSVTGARSLWGDGDYAFYAHNASLYQLSESGTSSQVNVTLHATNPICYARLGKHVYFSDEQQLRRVDGVTGAVDAATPEAPGFAPTLAATAAGGWPAGQYLVAVTFVRANGEESAPSDASIIDLTDGQAIWITALPQPVGSEILGVRIYVSDANEPVLYARRAVAVGVTQPTIIRTRAGEALRSENQLPMPAGHAMTFFQSRLWMAKDNVLYFSEPYLYGLTDYLGNSISYPKKLALLAAVGDGTPDAGLYVASGTRTYFIGHSDVQSKTNRVVYHHGAVFGSMALAPGSSFDPRLQLGTELVPVWLAKDGVICVGAPGGRVIPLTEGRCVTDIYTQAAAIFRKVSGAQQYVVAAPPGTTAVARASASDVMTATVVRNGITQP